LLDGIYVGFALALLFLHAVPGKVLYQRFLPSGEDLQWLGMVLTYAGAGVAIWARGSPLATIGVRESMGDLPKYHVADYQK